MMSLKSSKSKSTSRGLSVKESLEGPLFMQKTLSSNVREEPKRINSISLVSKNTPSKEILRDNKENHNVEKDFAGIANNSEYIKSLYRKYLGKDSETERERTIKTNESHHLIKEMKDSSIFNNANSKVNTFRESAQKPPMRSLSKRDTMSMEKENKSEEVEYRQLLELCDMEDSCVKAALALRQARRRGSVLFGH